MYQRTSKLFDNDPKVVLLDLKLPKLDGLEVLRVEFDPCKQMLPVVVLTSSHEECNIVESERLGVNSYIVKLVNLKQFT